METPVGISGIEDVGMSGVSIGVDWTERRDRAELRLWVVDIADEVEPSLVLEETELELEDM